METSTLGIYKLLKKSNAKFVDYVYLSRLLDVTNRNTLYKITNKLIDENVLTKLSKGKFVVQDAIVTDFEVANYLYKPSYISLESALSFYGILSQFTYTISSVSTKKSKNISFRGKSYRYSQLKNDFFLGYEKHNNFLIATKEKALFDSIYFCSKGLINLDFSELDFSDVNIGLLREIIFKTKDKALISFFERIILC